MCLCAPPISLHNIRALRLTIGAAIGTHFLIRSKLCSIILPRSRFLYLLSTYISQSLCPIYGFLLVPLVQLKNTIRVSDNRFWCSLFRACTNINETSYWTIYCLMSKWMMPLYTHKHTHTLLCEHTTGIDIWLCGSFQFS